MFWREFSAFLANLSGMWWSHGVAAGEQMKLQLWPLRMGWVWELPQVLGFRGSNVERTEPVPCQAAPGCWFRTQNLPLVHTWAAFTTEWEGIAAFQCHPQIPHQETAPNYTTGTNWILFWAFQKRGQGLSSLETKLPHEFPRTAPWRCSAARDSCGTSENTDFTFWGFCSFQLSPAFKSTYIKRKLNCPLQQRANHNKANILQQTIPLNPLKIAKSTFQCPLPIPGCQQHQCHSGLLSATSCGKNRPEIFHIPARFHIPRARNTSHSFPAGAL